MVLALHLEDHQLEGTSSGACTGAPDCGFRSIRFGLVTLVVVTRLDIGRVWSCPIDVETVAMLHPVAFECLVSFFIGHVSVIWRWINAVFGVGFHDDAREIVLIGRMSRCC